MITREQAEQAFHRLHGQDDHEMRHLEMQEENQPHMILYDEASGPYGVANTVWHCTYEIRYTGSRFPSLTKQWQKSECYIIEPQPPYPRVVDVIVLNGDGSISHENAWVQKGGDNV